MAASPKNARAPRSQLEHTKKEISILSRASNFVDAGFGVFALTLTLAVVSAVPVLNFASLGYLLEASARVAKTGRFRDGFPGLAVFSNLGKIALGVWLWILPIRFLHSSWRDAALIQKDNPKADELGSLLIVISILIGIHLVWAVIRGGKLRHFAWPAPVCFVRWLGSPLKLPRSNPSRLGWFIVKTPLSFLWLGARGFVGGLIWLAPGTSILMLSSASSKPGVAAVGGILGGLLLGIAVLFVPFLQTRFAISGRFSEFFTWRTAHLHFRKAPLPFCLALIVTLLFALPLYLLKIELAPEEVAWLPNLAFVVFILPARLLVGWAQFRAFRQESGQIWISRWAAILITIPVLATYVIIVWLTQFFSWHGSYSLLEQHAFLIPAPILGL